MTSAARADRAALAGLLLALAAVTLAVGARHGVPGVDGPTRRTVAVVVAADDGAMVYAHLSDGDGGVLARQVTTRVARLSAGTPILHRAQRIPTVASGDVGIQAAPDSLVRVEEDRDWRLQVGGDAVRGNVTLRDVAPSACGVTPARAAGALTQGDQVAFVVGPALVLERVTHGRQDAPGFWAVGVDVGVGVHLVTAEGACPAWTWSGAGAVTPVTTPSRAVLAGFRARGDSLRLGDGPLAWRLTLDEVADAAPLDPLVHMNVVERLLARPLVGGASMLARARMRVEIPGRPLTRIGALLLLPDAAPG